MLTTLRRVALALALVLPTVAFASPIQQDYPAAPDPYDTIVRIETETGHGTGFILDSGTVITAYHVVRGDRSVSIIRSDGAEHAANVVAYDSRADVAVLEVLGPPLDRSSHVICANPAVGERIHTVGHLLDLGRVEVSGEIAGPPVSVEQFVAVVPTGMPIGKGMSGGPVFDDRGNVVGIGAAFITRQGTGISLIVPGSEVCRVGRIGY